MRNGTFFFVYLFFFPFYYFVWEKNSKKKNWKSRAHKIEKLAHKTATINSSRSKKYTQYCRSVGCYDDVMWSYNFHYILAFALFTCISFSLLLYFVKWRYVVTFSRTIFFCFFVPKVLNICILWRHKTTERGLLNSYNEELESNLFSIFVPCTEYGLKAGINV